MPKEFDVFLSYSSKDKEVVHAIAERLDMASVHRWRRELLGEGSH